ncbi:hypothetical protein BJY00DRAFT_33857 [Aspergillus carlsbadensis]|nr:hypothetical protein BJY00DRAFT_33857 [Aspergillus carlsbadensis]
MTGIGRLHPRHWVRYDTRPITYLLLIIVTSVRDGLGTVDVALVPAAPQSPCLSIWSGPCPLSDVHPPPSEHCPPLCLLCNINSTSHTGPQASS